MCGLHKVYNTALTKNVLAYFAVLCDDFRSHSRATVIGTPHKQAMVAA